MNILLMTPLKVYDAWPVPIVSNAAKIPSVTLPQLAAMADPNDKIIIFDGDFQSISIGRFKRLVKKAQVIGITLTTPRMALPGEITIRMIKAVNPDAVVIMGGHHPSFHSKRWCELGVDIVVRREGELTFKECLDAVRTNRSFENIKGITWKNGNTIQVNPEREFICDLDSLPLPRWDLMNLDVYDMFFDIRGKTAAIETSRGCPHGCTFCIIHKMWNRSIRFKSPQRVIAEIDNLARLGVRKFGFIDDNFGMDTDIALDITDRIQKLSYPIRIGGFMRADTIDKHPKIIESASKAGLRYVLLGLESASEDVLNSVDKGSSLTLKDHRRIYKFLRKNNILVLGFYMFGYPGQPASDLDLIMKNGTGKTCDILMLATFDPLYGTEGHDYVEKEFSGLKDMFYHYQLFYSYPEQEALFKQRVWKNIRTFLSKETFTSVFSSDENKRNFYRYFYQIIAKSMLSVTPSRFQDFLTLKMPGSLDARQNALRSKYIDPAFIQKILNNESCIISPVR